MLKSQFSRPPTQDCERRWMSDEYFDLFVWYETEGCVHGFQLCYDKPHHERALTWTRQRGFQHTAIDSGESKPTANRTPVLIDNGELPVEEVRREFITRSRLLPAEIRVLVLTRISDYEQQQRGKSQQRA